MVFTQEEIKMRVLPIMKQNNIERAILFGSYGKGKATEESDIDLLVKSNLRGLAFMGFTEDIRESLDDKEVDIIDFSEIIPDSPIDREIRLTGVELYAR